ncbi:sensor histidine kinase [Ornithinimicrobium sufpigmenti]|uniref:sensor histidine kinase n=1 Tax=Ornithinimicrobium sufpigmenti TaxID=2508882 RepID=UPI001035C0FA|nr:MULTISPECIES: histidine kinase [unclassified Ornithinimicrobium]
MNRDSELAAVAQGAVTFSREAPSGTLPFGIRWRDLLIVVLAFIGDLFFLGVFTNELNTRHGDAPVSPVVAVVVVAAMATALLWRWRAGFPVLVYVLAITVGLILWVQESLPIICVLVALYAAARDASHRTAALVLGVGLGAVAISTAAVVSNDGVRDLQFSDVALPAGVLASVMLMVWIFARREQHASRRAAALATQMDAHAELATRAERERIARELHDILAHSVSAMMMQAAGARALGHTVADEQPPDERVQTILEALSSIETTGSQSLRELHRLLGTSVSAAPELEVAGPSEPPGLAQLDDLVRTGRRSGLMVNVHRTGTPGELDPSVGIAAYRTVQESLTNALKHLGRGAVVDIHECWDEREVRVQVRCRGGRDSMRVDAPQGGLGLRGLRERVELAGGTFEAGWLDDQFVTTALLPQSAARSGAREEES